MTTINPPKARAAAEARLELCAKALGHPDAVATLSVIADGYLPATDGAGGRFPLPYVGRPLESLGHVLVVLDLAAPSCRSIELCVTLGVEQYRTASDPFAIVVDRLCSGLGKALS